MRARGTLQAVTGGVILLAVVALVTMILVLAKQIGDEAPKINAALVSTCPAATAILPPGICSAGRPVAARRTLTAEVTQRARHPEQDLPVVGGR